jgi:hypothetical protein
MHTVSDQKSLGVTFLHLETIGEYGASGSSRKWTVKASLWDPANYRKYHHDKIEEHCGWFAEILGGLSVSGSIFLSLNLFLPCSSRDMFSSCLLSSIVRLASFVHNPIVTICYMSLGGRDAASASTYRTAEKLLFDRREITTAYYSLPAVSLLRCFSCSWIRFCKFIAYSTIQEK